MLTMKNKVNDHQNFGMAFCRSPGCIGKCGRKMNVYLLGLLEQEKAEGFERTIWVGNFCDENGETIEC